MWWESRCGSFREVELQRGPTTLTGSNRLSNCTHLLFSLSDVSDVIVWLLKNATEIFLSISPYLDSTQVFPVRLPTPFPAQQYTPSHQGL